MTTLADVMEFLATTATQSDVDRIHTAANERTRVLRTVRAAAIDVGVPVKIVNIKPKTLAGLTGKVQSHDGKSAVVLLDESSTDILRFSRIRAAAYVPTEVTEYPFTGIPLTCLEVNE
jgi:hypothetical protein